MAEKDDAKMKKVWYNVSMRIISGKFKGAVLNTFEAENIRPTIDRVREAVFSKIQFDVANSVVLDLFGGTGAVSLEFLSRGAKKVYTVDNNDMSIRLINQNFRKLKQVPSLIQMNFIKALDKLKNEKFDFIYLDPPFDTNFAEKSIARISEFGMLNDDGLIIYEHIAGKQFSLPDNFEVIDEKKYGTVIVTYIGVKNG